MLDLVIVGAGPAGLSACLYASRAGLDVLVLDMGAPGGKLNVTAQIENYPGLKATPGPEIAYTMYESALSFGAKLDYGEVLDIKVCDDHKEVITAKKVYETKYVLIATGTKERQMNLPKENELVGRGISYCAVCDGPFFKGEDVADMAKRGVKVVAMEASSHGLALKRIDGVEFNTAVLTNVGEEHLDFHGTRERYIESKKKLFSMLSANSLAVLNKDEEVYDDFKKATKARVISFGIENDSEIMAKNIQLSIDHSEFDLCLKGNVYHIDCPIVAKFNIYNVLATVGVLIGLGFDDRMIVEALHNLQPIPGRMEIIPNNHKITIIVDYCQHTRDHKNVFEFVSEVAKGRIIAVLGAPCKRHIKRRKALGQLANQYLDHVILTEVDNRGENVEDICYEIQDEIKDIPSIIITKREIAVEQAIEQACPGDIVLLLGKGQEKFISLEVGQEYYPGDKEIALMAMKRIYEGENEDELQQDD